MRPAPQADLYSPGEIAIAAGVSEAAVRAALGAAREFVSFEEAVLVGRRLAVTAPPEHRSTLRAPIEPGVAIEDPDFDIHIPQARGVPLVVSTTLHVVLIAVLLFATFNLAPRAAALRADTAVEPMRLVFLATPGPGGGGGGGGLLQKAPPPKAQRAGTRTISSPLPKRVEPKPIEPAPKPEPPPPPLKSEQLPAVVAPIITAPADA